MLTNIMEDERLYMVKSWIYNPEFSGVTANLVID